MKNITDSDYSRNSPPETVWAPFGLEWYIFDLTEIYITSNQTGIWKEFAVMIACEGELYGLQA